MPVAALLVGLLRRRPQRAVLARRIGGVAALMGAVGGGIAFLTLSAGAFVPTRSPGALDNGGSTALLVKLVQTLAEQSPLVRTEVEIALLSAEEVGVQGSIRFIKVSKYATVRTCFCDCYRLSSRT